MCPPLLRARQGPNTTIKLDNSLKCSAKNSGQNQECWIIHTFFNLYPPPLWDIEDRRRWGHNVEDSDIEDRQRWGQATLRTDNVEYRRRWGQATLRTNSSPNTFPNPGPEGPTETLQLTYILKCWQHISNKICSFPKCWHHISNIFDNFWKF